MPTLDSRKNKTCIVCRKKIEQTVIPWSMVNITGDVVYWHPVCDDDRQEFCRNGSADGAGMGALEARRG